MACAQDSLVSEVVELGRVKTALKDQQFKLVLGAAL
jgi:hypothetical protein